MFILLINCLIDDAKVRRFWEMEKYLLDFCLKLWRQGRESATICKKAAESRRNVHILGTDLHGFK